MSSLRCFRIMDDNQLIGNLPDTVDATDRFLGHLFMKVRLDGTVEDHMSVSSIRAEVLPKQVR